MLPDFLALKAELAKEQAFAITHNRSGEPLLSQIANYVHHEGKGFILRREDGSQETVDYKLMSGSIQIHLKDIQQKGEVAIDEALKPPIKRSTTPSVRLCSKHLIELFPLLMRAVNRFQQN